MPPVIPSPLPRTWRAIPQPISPRAMSPEGRRRRRRRMMGLLVLTVGLGGTAWGGIALAKIWRQDPTALLTPDGAAPVRTLTLHTDGVLDAVWLRSTLALPSQTGLLALDLAALQTRLRASGQVRQAELTRLYPDTLVVTLQERVPVARVMARSGGAAPREFLVARDGTVFADQNHSPEFIAALPYLDGVHLVRAGAGFAPLPDLPAVAALLEAARARQPELARGFHVVSLGRMESDHLLIIRSDAVQEIIFDAQGDYFQQLAWLGYVLGNLTPSPSGGALGSINLALGGGQVPVSRHLSLAVAPPPPLFPPPRSPVGSPASLFTLPSLSSNSHDL